MPATLHIPLHDYQQTAKDFLVTHPKAGLFLDVGFGKTAATLEALLELADLNQLFGHILIVAPKAIAQTTWIDEMHKWGVNANIVSLVVNKKGRNLSKKARLELYEQIAGTPPSFYMIGRELVTDLIQWHLDNKKPWPFPNLIIDELHSFKSYSSQRFKMLKKIMPHVNRFIGLTGTPIPNGLMDLWPEIYLMDSGQRLGRTITEYRTTYFRPGYVMANGIPVTWIPLPGSEQVIYDKISDLVISIKNPGLKLPPVIYNDMFCEMSDSEMAQYRTLMKEQVLDLKNTDGTDASVEAPNAAILSAKLSQMASGTVYTDEQHNYAEIHTRKLDSLEYIINNTTTPVLVAYHFRNDKQRIEERCKKLGVTAETFDGSSEMTKRWNNRQIPVMLIQPASKGSGVNIQFGGHTLVWFTLPYSLEQYIQTCGRLNRQGQTEPVVIHHILTKNTIDSRILAAINKKDLSERALLDAVSATITDSDCGVVLNA